jgi:hypothetical protein
MLHSQPVVPAECLQMPYEILYMESIGFRKAFAHSTYALPQQDENKKDSLILKVSSYSSHRKFPEFYFKNSNAEVLNCFITLILYEAFAFHQ